MLYFQNFEKQNIIQLTKLYFGDKVRAIYIFGSRSTGDAQDSSDLDVAILIEHKPSAELAYALKTDLSVQFRCDVDLVDIMRADSVTKAQIVSTGEMIFAIHASEVAAFETRTYSEYALLNEERAGIIEDVLNRGSIHG